MMAPEPMTQAAADAFPLRRFAATQISRAIEDDLRALDVEGAVEAVHRSALNIRWGPRLLTVAHPSMGGLPNGILVEPPIGLDQIGIAPGMGAVCDGSTLRVPGAGMVVFLSGAARWSPSMAAYGGLTMAGRTERAERTLSLAASDAPWLGLGPLLLGLVDPRQPVGSLGRAAARSLGDVVEALGDSTAEAAVAAAFPLIGLGPGATPSGDDLLVGLSAGLAATGHPLARSFASGVARDAVGLTTSVAESYLFHAGRLEFSERVHAAALAILKGRLAELPGAVTAALAWGASSGADLLVGLLVGIEAADDGLAQRLRACASERDAVA
jgi:hypothetical protein